MSFLECREENKAVLLKENVGNTSLSLVGSSLKTFCDQNCTNSCRVKTMRPAAIRHNVHLRLNNASYQVEDFISPEEELARSQERIEQLEARNS